MVELTLRDLNILFLEFYEKGNNVCVIIINEVYVYSLVNIVILILRSNSFNLKKYENVMRLLSRDKNPFTYLNEHHTYIANVELNVGSVFYQLDLKIN